MKTFTRITIRGKIDKHIYYDNNPVETDKIKKVLSDIQPDLMANTGEEAEGFSKEKLLQWLVNVNENDISVFGQFENESYLSFYNQKIARLAFVFLPKDNLILIEFRLK